MLIDFCPWIADIVPSAITKLTIHAVVKKYSKDEVIPKVDGVQCWPMVLMLTIDCRSTWPILETSVDVQV